MHSHLYRRHRRLTGVASLFDLALRGLVAGSRQRPRLPTSARLRRDIGLPEIEDVPATQVMPHRRPLTLSNKREQPMPSVLIAGATGYLGRFLCAAYRVARLSRHGTGAGQAARGGPSRRQADRGRGDQPRNPVRRHGRHRPGRLRARDHPAGRWAELRKWISGPT
jgi:hypothetical protein